MARVSVSLDAHLVVEVMVLSDIRNAQDAVEAILRDYVAKGHRTEALTGSAIEDRRMTEVTPPTEA